MTYPGLDITAGVLPFFRRDTAMGAGGGRGGSASATFCRLGRRADGVFAGSDAGGGLGSRAGALRFLGGAGARVGGAVAGTAAELPGDDSEELAALVDALVTLGDMICEYVTLV
jgi:hypothetical protein